MEQDREGEEAKPACGFRSGLGQDPGGLWKVSYTGKFSPGAEELGFLTLLLNSYWLVVALWGVGCTLPGTDLPVGRGHPQRRYAGAACGKHSEGGRKGCTERVNLGRSFVLAYFKLFLPRHLSRKNRGLASPFPRDNERQGDREAQNDPPVIREGVVTKDAVGT